LGEVVGAIAHTHDTDLAGQYHRLAKRRGVHKAVVAVAHSILIVMYHVLRTGQPYADLGADDFDQLDAQRLRGHHVRRLEQLGYVVTLTPAQPA
jgi:hypothetical protein